MELIVGVGLLCVAALLFCAVLIGARNPKCSAWFGEFMIGAIYVPFLIVLMVIGMVLTVSFFFAIKMTAMTTGIGITEDGVAIAMVVGTTILIKAFRIKKRLARFDGIENAQRSA